MLSEEEKREMRELAGSAAIRDEFRLLRRLSRAHQRVDVDQFIQFLTAMSRLSARPAVPRAFVRYTQVKI